MALSVSSLLSSLLPAEGVLSNAVVVGIDVGSAAIKIVELEQSEQGPILKTYGEIQLGPYAAAALGQPVEASPEMLQKAIVDVLRESGAQGKQGVLSLPLNAGFVTVISVPVPEGEDISSRIPVEARKYIPVPLGEVTLDWAVLPDQDEDASTQSVLLVALQNESLRTYTTLLKKVSLANQPMELETFSSYRATADTALTHEVVIDFGAQVSKLYVFNAGSLVRIHRVSVGGADVTERISVMQSIDFGQAELLKRSSSAEAAAIVQQATAAALSRPLQEFARLLTQHEQTAGVQLEQITIIGGMASTPGVSQLVAQALGRTVKAADPFSKIAYPAFMEDTMRAIGPTFANSIGAALRLID